MKNQLNKHIEKHLILKKADYAKKRFLRKIMGHDKIVRPLKTIKPVIFIIYQNAIFSYEQIKILAEDERVKTSSK